MSFNHCLFPLHVVKRSQPLHLSSLFLISYCKLVDLVNAMPHCISSTYIYFCVKPFQLSFEDFQGFEKCNQVIINVMVESSIIKTRWNNAETDLRIRYHYSMKFTSTLDAVLVMYRMSSFVDVNVIYRPLRDVKLV